MVNAIPVVGWIISWFFLTSMAVPFWFCWTQCGIGRTYFAFLPEAWMAIPFWDCVGLFTCMVIVKFIFLPRLASSSSTSSNDSKR